LCSRRRAAWHGHAIIKNGETHVDAVGTHEVGGGTPMRRDTIFRIASITKSIVGSATMRLVEEGKLAIDRQIPELANRRVLKRLDGPLMIRCGQSGLYWSAMF
jgi:hypothetical protein